jgi:hypothetical protein
MCPVEHGPSFAAKAYSLASWTVEHFRNPDSRVDRVVDFLVNMGPPDVFALYEVEGKEVLRRPCSKMPGYTFHITEGPQVQEIMVGVKSSLAAFFTQKTEFKSGRRLAHYLGAYVLAVGNDALEKTALPRRPDLN